MRFARMVPVAIRILGRENPRAEVFSPTRFDFGASKRDLLDHNKHAMGHFFQDHLREYPSGVGHDLDRGEATVLEIDGDPVGVYHDDVGEYHVVSAVCTHMGCHVEWNDAEESWDCPCHGSRFDHDGSVLDTPAVEELEQYALDELPFPVTDAK
jgi:Rieske Fe-S protein